MVGTPLLKKRIRFKKIEKKKVYIGKLAAAAVAVSIHESLQEYAAAAAVAVEIHELLKAVAVPQPTVPQAAPSSWVVSWRLEASAHLHRRGRIRSW